MSGTVIEIRPRAKVTHCLKNRAQTKTNLQISGFSAFLPENIGTYPEPNFNYYVLVYWLPYYTIK